MKITAIEGDNGVSTLAWFTGVLIVVVMLKRLRSEK